MACLFCRMRKIACAPPVPPDALDVGIKFLATFKDKVESPLVKKIFEPAIAILTIVKVGWYGQKGDAFAELAGLCSKTCHTLETVDDLAGFDEHIEDLGRFVDAACLLLSIITRRSEL
ncbi:hypothetical protein BJ322DRAFT_1112305 [Thelephora terrestris]|uniref:Uncharacterized protein n=1 Tax=Thelephora terrestris TaxID=56493 RepID=A0A9P6H9A8_9AGAM|nr:hypothetical protein BJ322DRAFT_1112305 [Thelephora terrestris]